MHAPRAGKRATNLSRRRPAVLALVIAVLAVSWAAILIRLAGADPMVIAFWRLALATLLLFPVAGWPWLRQRRPVTVERQGIFAPVLAPGCLLALHFALWIHSLFLTTVASSVILVSTQPLFAALVAGRLLGEAPLPRTWWAIAVTVMGVALIATGDLGLSARAVGGDLMAMAAAAAAALYLVLGRRARESGPLLLYLLKVNGIAAAVLLAGCLLKRAPLLGHSRSTWEIFLALAVGPHLAGHGLLNLAVRWLPAPMVNLSLAGEPVLSTLYAAVLFQEWPGSWFYAGAGLVLAGLALEFLGPRVADRPASRPGCRTSWRDTP
ncbi:MAG: DMT family transporter [Acidobacteriota bacterium]